MIPVPVPLLRRDVGHGRPKGQKSNLEKVQTRTKQLTRCHANSSRRGLIAHKGRSLPMSQPCFHQNRITWESTGHTLALSQDSRDSPPQPLNPLTITRQSIAGGNLGMEMTATESSSELASAWRRPWAKPNRNYSISLWAGDKATTSGEAAKRLTPPPKIPSAKICWKSSRLAFLGSRRLPPHYLPKSQTINVEYYSSLLAQLKDILEGKRRGKVTKGGSCSCTTMPRLTGNLQPRRNWSTWGSNILITHPILRIWPRRTTTCALKWKKNFERSPLFFRRGGHCCRGDLVGRATFWFFLSGF